MHAAPSKLSQKTSTCFDAHDPSRYILGLCKRIGDQVEGGDPPDNSEKGLVARAETGAADGGYRMRPPSQALVPEARTTSAPPEDARKTAKASPAMGKGDDSPASPVRVESDFGTGISSGVKTVDADGGDASVPKSPSEMAGPDAFLAVANELQDQAKDAAAARDALRESDRKDGERKREKPVRRSCGGGAEEAYR